ncbi:hypothetical protein DPX39_060049500 [Trypanosoma brucei equiperdum]|uniref:Uncharacterized protein n=1 Tax=Trypanosoma brucei equiperdum TaxID=630700 RepID=A0A3L6L694_9TRYP|nr:hypothetical protein DPX39_060049500 [Trypanosoma brucei equiperdum]
MAAQHTCLVRVNLYLFDEKSGQYEDYGPVGCTIIGTLSDPPIYKMGCYDERSEYLCTAVITSNNETGACIALQEGGYVSFKDEQGRCWSMLFEEEDEAIKFCAHVTVAMYGVSGSPEQSIIACDVTMGNRDRIILANDQVKVRYICWVIQAENPRKELPTLGSKLDGNLHDDKPVALCVPTNHLSVTPDMKGFEGMLIGMTEKGSRFVVVPSKVRRGAGAQVHTCFFMHVVKKKDTLTGEGNNSGVVPFLTSPSNMSGQKADGVSNLSPDAAYAVPPPPAGFNREQLSAVDRLRDCAELLTRQLQSIRQQLDVFMNDVKLFERDTKPHSLSSAQVEYSVQKLMSDTEQNKELLSQKEITLKQMEEKNRDLQKKVEKFSATTNMLAEEKKSTINLLNENKLDLDRRLADAQAQLTRIHSEREDVSRHLSSVKQLLHVTDQDIKTEKRSLQVASVVLQTNKAKLAAAEAAHTEESSRRKIMESNATTLNDQLRSITDDIRLKEGQIEEQRQKIESDKLHYVQLIEDERGKGAEDVRELRQELLEELSVRERRYQEERQRVAQDSFERGRFQGIEDAQNEALVEADAATQELSITIQRRKAELNAMCVRLRVAKEQNEADECRVGAQVVVLEKTISTVTAQNTQMEVELNSLKTAADRVESDVFASMRSTVEKLSHPIGRDDLLALIHSLRMNENVSYDFETKREEERQAAIDRERREVMEWVSGTIKGDIVRFPPTHVPYFADGVELNSGGTGPLEEGGQLSHIVELRFDDINNAKESEKCCLDDVNALYRSLLLESLVGSPCR